MANGRRPREHGSAGSGLNSASARSKFGDNAAVGAAGERYFREAIVAAGLTREYDVWYSLPIPNDPSNPSATRFSSDVDVALASGNRLVLVDVKRWAAGQFYWSAFGRPMKGLAPMAKGGKWTPMSKNMAAAVARYRKNLPGIQVSAIVVFVPSSARGAMPSSVALLRWPGGIRSYLSGDGIRRLKRMLGRPEPTDARLEGFMNKMGQKR